MRIEFSDWAENIVGKEEIACYELSVVDALKWESVVLEVQQVFFF